MHLALKKGTKDFHYMSNFGRIFSEFSFSLEKNSNGEYEGLGIL